MPDSIGPYEVIRPIAQGGMAEVFEVRDPVSGERLALKMLMDTKSSIKRFNREFEALTRLNHPTIVRVYRYGFHERMPWITMELLDGEPLQQRVKRLGDPGAPERTLEVLRIGFLLANALQYIHDRGLVHRDLKSANVQVLYDGRVKVIDFGTAHLAHPLERITGDGDFVGTYSYASPEQIVGQPVDHRADLYSLGVLLYRLATGRRPFKGDDPQQIAQMHLRQLARPMREFVPDLPEELERVVHWLMEKKKRDRPQSAEEVARALEDIAGQNLGLPGLGFAFNETRSIGREAEHRALWQRLAAADGVVGRYVVGGDAVERARFGAQVGEDARRRDWRAVVIGTAEDPLRALAAGLRALAMGAEGTAAAEVLRIVGDLRGLLRSSLSDAVSAVAGPFARMLSEQPRRAVLVIEDVGAMDAAGVSGLQQVVYALVKRKVPCGVVLLAASRASDALGAMSRVIQDAETVELAPLDVAATGLAMAELLHRRPPALELARALHEASCGRPTLIDGVLREWAARGELVVRGDDGNRVEWNGDPDLHDLAGPDLLEELDARLASVSSVGRRVLEVVGLAGGAASLTVVARGLGWEPGEARIALLDLVERGTVAWSAGGDVPVRAADPVVLRGVMQQLQPARRRSVQVAIADVLPTDPPTAAAADAMLAAGRPEAAVSLALAAGERLLASARATEVLALLERVRGPGTAAGMDPTLRASWQLLYGRCLRMVRPMDPASLRALHAADGLRQDPLWSARVQLALAEVQGGIGHPGNYRKHLMAAWELVDRPPRPPLAGEVALLLAEQSALEGDLSGARRWLGGAAGVPSTLAYARLGEAELSVVAGRLGEAEGHVGDVLSGAVETALRWAALAVRAEILRRQGRFSEALVALEGGIVEARAAAHIASVARLRLVEAAIELDLYRLGNAVECVDDVVGLLGRGERLHLRLAARLLQGRIQLASGQLGAARFLLEEVTQQAELGGLIRLAEAGRGSLAEALWATGERKMAMDAWRQAARRLREMGDLAALADVIIGRARAVGVLEAPEASFRLVAALLDEPEQRVLYLESLLAEHRWHRGQGEVEQAARALAEVQMVLNKLAARQSRVEQAALRVHPWTREVRQALDLAAAAPVASP